MSDVGAAMIIFFFIGKPFLNLLGVDVRSFAVAGSIVIFILGLEMVLGIEFFKSDKDAKAGNLVPIAFPLIAGSGTLTTIMSLKATYEKSPDKNEMLILIAILINLVIIYIVLRSLNRIEKLLGPAGLIAVRKFFGVVLLPIWSCSTMDSIRVSEALDSSSILDGTTPNRNPLTISGFYFLESRIPGSFTCTILLQIILFN